MKAISKYTDDELRQELFDLYKRLGRKVSSDGWLADYNRVGDLEAEVMRRVCRNIEVERERRHADLNMHWNNLVNEVTKPLVRVVDWLERMIEKIQKWAEGVK